MVEIIFHGNRLVDFGEGFLRCLHIETYYNRIRAHSAVDFVALDVFNLGRVA